MTMAHRFVLILAAGLALQPSQRPKLPATDRVDASHATLGTPYMHFPGLPVDVVPPETGLRERTLDLDAYSDLKG